MKDSDASKQDPDEDQLTSCGMGAWRPRWLQSFANPIAFLVNICVVGIVQGVASALFYSTANTLEKRYAYDSKITGIILIADNIANLVVCWQVH